MFENCIKKIFKGKGLERSSLNHCLREDCLRLEGCQIFVLNHLNILILMENIDLECIIYFRRYHPEGQFYYDFIAGVPLVKAYKIKQNCLN